VRSKTAWRRAAWGEGRPLAEVGEGRALEALIELAGPPPPGAAVAPGDDAADLGPLSGGPVLLSTDSLCEDVDFRRQYQSPYQVGWKAWMAAASDLAAMGARVDGGLAAALVPDLATENELMAIQLGLVEAAAADSARVLGGDLSRTPGPLAVTVTVMGHMEAGRPVALGGGSPGELLVLTGSVGAAAMALQLLESGQAAVPPPWLERLLLPTARVEAGVALQRGGVRAMTDISDGLLLDLSRLCRASRVGAELWLDRVPLAPGSAPGCDQLRSALSGGEDFELLAAIPEPDLEPLRSRWEEALPPLAVVGRLVSGGGVVLRSRPGGDVVTLQGIDGYRHF
ncbi:MAG: thiamine-phosphate kinase, partial [Candidatus Dormibacteria bacterium]